MLSQEEKNAWALAAKGDNRTLSNWARDTLAKRAGKTITAPSPESSAPAAQAEIKRRKLKP